MKRLFEVILSLTIILLFFGCINKDYSSLIQLNGDEVVTLEVGTGFTDPSATCIDENEKCTIRVLDTEVDINTVGTYVVRYQGIISDSVVIEKERTVMVVDKTGPSININGEKNINLEYVVYTKS